MKKVRKVLSLLVVTGVTLAFASCKDGGNDDSMESTSSGMGQEGGSNEVSTGVMADSYGNTTAESVVNNYLRLTSALAASDQNQAAEAGRYLVADFKGFDKSSYSSAEQQELTDIVEDATEHAEHISKSDLGHQREHFDILSKDVIDMIAITGTERNLYQYFCSMYNGDKGGQWLSDTKEVKNPYFGSQMMSCGELQK